MTVHAEYALRRAGISQVLNLFLAIAALEAVCTKGLVSREDGQVLNLVPTAAAAVCAVVANQ